MALRNGVTKFIEVKRENGVLSELQKVRIKQLKEKGFECVIWTDYETEY
jgi:predicted DNA-binding antitoxin AbrB/MazE fold protein